MHRVARVGCALLAVAAASTEAGTWQASTTAAYPGQTVTVDVHFQGDGVSNGTDVTWYFDITWLELEAPAGQLPATGAGQCGFDGGGAVGAIYINLGTTPLPSSNTLVCSFPLKVRSNAQPGRARILGVSPTCVRTDGNPASCTVVDGWVDVLGQAQGAAYGWSEEETNELAIVFAPSAVGSKAGDPVRGLVPVDSQPRAVRPFVARVPSASEDADYRANPDRASARLHRLWLAEFADSRSRDSALQQLRASPLVEGAVVRRISVYGPVLANTNPRTGASAASSKGLTTAHQVHRHMSRIPEAWGLAGGWGLIAVVDTGIAVEHPELKSFSGLGSQGGTFLPGGNHLPYFSVNAVDQDQPAAVDELIPTQGGPPGSLPASCDPDGDGWLLPPVAGHGTHVAGLVAANADDGVGVSGVCRGCGLGMVKASLTECFNNNLRIQFPLDEGLLHALEMGAQVVNLSGGNPYTFECTSKISYEPLCIVAESLHERDIFLSASSGNQRSSIQAPADSRWAVAVGGIDTKGELWDKSPGDITGCPYYNDGLGAFECGSNYAVHSLEKQELVTLAHAAVSTVYPGRDWNTRIGCGDNFGLGAGNDGLGVCTGTSMSAPQVSGIAGLLRSIHPLLRVGSAFTQSPLTPSGLRKVMADTASRSKAGLPLDSKLGFGQPDAAAAARVLLGIQGDEAVRNRAIPLFSMSHAASGDHAAVATPQLAMTLLNVQNYVSDDDSINPTTIAGFPSFPFPNPNTATVSPRARAFVLSTEHSPRPGLLPLDPLFLMVKTNGATRDHVLVSGTAKVQVAANAGYRYAGRQGYLYRDCTGQSGCVRPPGTELLYLRCRSSGGCAVFPQLDNTLFASMGYTQNFPGLGNPRLGYAYKRGDIDGDGLPDAAEYVLGTRRDIKDTDGDGVWDSVEYPFADVPLSDPCDGKDAHRCVGRWSIFFDGFED